MIWTLTLIFILGESRIPVSVPTSGQDECVEMAISFERAYREAGIDIMTRCTATPESK